MSSSASRLLLIFVVVVVAGFVLWKSRVPSPEAPPSQPGAQEPASPTARSGAPPANVPPDQAAPGGAPPTTAAQPPVPGVPAGPAPGVTAPPPPRPMARDEIVELDSALENVQLTLRDFRTRMGGNPTGSNAEITRAFMGNNPKGMRLPAPDGSSVNGEGELCDRWGTPYFLHQVSKDRMEVRSAGPDKVMWTGDDRQQ